MENGGLAIINTECLRTEKYKVVHGNQTTSKGVEEMDRSESSTLTELVEEEEG